MGHETSEIVVPFRHGVGGGERQIDLEIQRLPALVHIAAANPRVPVVAKPAVDAC